MTQVNEALNKYLEPEKLSGEEQWHCERCKKKVDATKKIDLWKLPAVLVLHLKRFEYDAKNQQFQKTDNRLNMKLHDVDLTKYCSSEQRDGASYSVACVANHAGTYEDGHYTATCKVGGKGSNTWHHFSDSAVKAYSGRSVVTRETYVIFLVRNPNGADSSRSQTARSQKNAITLRRQELTRPEDWPHPEESVTAVLNATGRGADDVNKGEVQVTPPKGLKTSPTRTTTRASMVKTPPSKATSRPSPPHEKEKTEGKSIKTLLHHFGMACSSMQPREKASTPDSKRKEESDVAGVPRPGKQRKIDRMFNAVPLRGPSTAPASAETSKLLN